MFADPRPGTVADAVVGTVPRWVYSPQTIEEAGEIVEATGRDELSIAFVGGGTELELGNPIRKIDAVLRTGGLSRIVEYAPTDMIVTVEAGITLAALSETLRRNSQRLALDPALPERATVGGIIAANSFGPRRARFGSVRDLLIGISIVRADGTRVRGGGRVVKNVAGFDIPKLMCGSLGTLGLIATATFRLHPMCEAEQTVLVPGCTATQVRSLIARLKAAQLEPTSVVAMSTRGGVFEGAVRFEGFSGGVSQQTGRFAELQRTASQDCVPLDDRGAAAWWARHDEARTRGNVRVKIAALPSQIEEVASRVDRVLATLRQPTFIWYASLGLGFVTGTSDDLEATARALEHVRLYLEEDNGSLVLHAAPQVIRESLVEWCSPPSAFFVMHRLKERFDPQHRLNPGRFVGGI